MAGLRVTSAKDFIKFKVASYKPLDHLISHLNLNLRTKIIVKEEKHVIKVQ